MKYENFEVGVYDLQRGVDKLLTYGMDTLELFSDENDISFCDRNRIISKCIVAHGKKELSELPCPKNLIGERWKFFTKTMGYTNEKAREIIARTDLSFNSADISKLVGGIG
jgi:hypothetical protein